MQKCFLQLQWVRILKALHVTDTNSWSWKSCSIDKGEVSRRTETRSHRKVWMPCGHSPQKDLPDTAGETCPKHVCFFPEILKTSKSQKIYIQSYLRLQTATWKNLEKTQPWKKHSLCSCIWRGIWQMPSSYLPSGQRERTWSQNSWAEDCEWEGSRHALRRNTTSSLCFAFNCLNKKSSAFQIRRCLRIYFCSPVMKSITWNVKRKAKSLWLVVTCSLFQLSWPWIG